MTELRLCGLLRYICHPGWPSVAIIQLTFACWLGKYDNMYLADSANSIQLNSISFLFSPLLCTRAPRSTHATAWPCQRSSIHVDTHRHIRRGVYEKERMKNKKGAADLFWNGRGGPWVLCPERCLESIHTAHVYTHRMYKRFDF